MNQFNFPGLTLMKAVATAESIQDPDDQTMFMSSLTQECDLYHRVAAFMYFFGQLEKDKPLGFDKTKLVLGLKLVTEEFKEIFEKGLGIDVQIQFWDTDKETGVGGWLDERDLTHVVNNSDESKWDIVEFADALGDLKYVSEWNSLAHGIPQPLVDWEIHCSNMTKLGEGGQPLVNGPVGSSRFDDGGHEIEVLMDPSKPFGKVLKGPNYVEPDLASILGLGDSN